MPAYMNGAWLSRVVRELEEDIDLPMIQLDNGILASESLVDSLQHCYADEPNMNN